MKPILLTMFLFTLCCTSAWPQVQPQGLVRGRAVDKSSGQPLDAASVALLRKKDSVRVAFSFTDKDGEFTLPTLPEGHYWLHLSYLGYQPLLLELTLTAARRSMDLGPLVLQRTGLTLAAVEIAAQKPPMLIKKDTLEFNAAYFRTRENALMEQLLKKLPGVQIDRDGAIKVNGVPVSSIMIDGVPFFGGNPLLASRNLAAGIIDKVQLIDQESGPASLGGTNEGQPGKVINITIKKSKQDQWLGRAIAGYGSDKRFAAKASLSRFGAGQQLSFLGSGDNVNGYQETGAMRAGGNGIMRAWNGGVHYNKVINPQWKIGGSYAVNDRYRNFERSSARQNLLPDTSFYYNQHSLYRFYNRDHALDMRLDYTKDTSLSFSLALSLNQANNTTSQESSYTSLDAKQQVVNSGMIRNTEAARFPGLSTRVAFIKRFRKRGRMLSIHFNGVYYSSAQQGYNRSHNAYVLPNNAYADTIDQHLDISGRQQRTQLDLVYTEPLFTTHFLQFAYHYTRRYALSDKATYDYNASKGSYDQRNDSLSNAFRNVSALHLASMYVGRQQDSFEYHLGLDIQLSDMDGYNISRQSSLQQRSIHFFPKAYLVYSFPNNSRLRFTYAGSVDPPELHALQPVPDNSNPLYVRLGNPDLAPAFTHRVRAEYNRFNLRNLRSLAASISTAFMQNRIVDASWFDSLGRQYSQPQNVNGSYRIDVSLSHSLQLQQQLSISANTLLGLHRNVGFVNGVKQQVHNLRGRQELSLDYAHAQLFDLALTAGVDYNGARYAGQAHNNTSFFNYTGSLDGQLQLPLGFSIGANLEYIRNTGRGAGYNVDALMLSGYLSKSIFRDKKGLIKVQGFDLLQQNLSISRNVGESYIEDVSINVLQRFFMLSVAYFLK